MATSMLTKDALAAKARRGERTGGVPVGYRVGADGVSLERDPAELTNLIDSKAHVELSHDMESRLTGWFQEFEQDDGSEPRGDDSEELDEATKEALRSLGYLE